MIKILEKNYQLTLDFSIEIELNTDPIPEETEGTNALVHDFVREFIQNKDALSAYYKNALYEILFSDYKESERIKKLFDYQKNFAELFLQVAENCAEHVVQFIRHTFNYEKEPSKSQYINITAVMDLLEKKLGIPRIDSVDFQETGEMTGSRRVPLVKLKAKPAEPEKKNDQPEETPVERTRRFAV